MTAATPPWTLVYCVDTRASARMEVDAPNVQIVKLSHSASPTDAAVAGGSQSSVDDAIADSFPELTLPSTRAPVFWRARVTLALWRAKLVLSDHGAGKIESALRAKLAGALGTLAHDDAWRTRMGARALSRVATVSGTRSAACMLATLEEGAA